MDTMINNINNVQYPKTVWANNIINLINEQSKALRDMVLSNDQQSLQDLLSKYKFYSDSATENYDSLNRAITTPEGKALLAKVMDQRSSYVSAAQTVIDQVKTGNKDSAVAILYGGFRNAEHDYMNGINDLINLQSKRVDDAASFADQASHDTKLILIIIGGFSFLFVLGLGLIISINTVKPLKIVVDRLAQLQNVCITNLGDGLLAMSKGDLNTKVAKATKTINSKRTDEIGMLASTVDKVIVQSQGGIDAYEIVRDKINQLNKETSKLISDSKDGKLDNRGDLSKFEGFYKELIHGINSVLDAVIMPIKDGSGVLDVFATAFFSNLTCIFRNISSVTCISCCF